MKKTYFTISILASLFITSSAMAGYLDQRLSQAWVQGEGDSYFQAQNNLLNDAEAVTAWVKDAHPHAAYDEENWVELVVREATALRVNQAGEVARLYELNGLRSENYLRWRRPEPAVLRELKPMRHLAASMMELYQLGFDSYPWSGPAYEKSERLALQMGLLHAIGESEHPARVYFLSHVVDSGFNSRAVRLSALSALAKTGEQGALKILAGLLEDAEHDDEMRAWLAGSLGHIRSLETWPMVESLLADQTPSVQKASLASVRLLLSRWHWDGRANELEALRSQVTPVLVKILERPEPGSYSNLGETLSLVGGKQLIKSLQLRVKDPALKDDVRSRMQSVLSLVERAERRRHN